MLKKLSLLGIISPLLYLLHVIVGSILWRDYNQITQPISDLTATGAPNKDMLCVITSMYGLFQLIFIISAYVYLRKLKIKAINVSMMLFIVMTLITFSYGVFPEDIPGTTMTFNGLMHLVVTGLIVPIAILAPLFAGVGFKKLKNFKCFSVYSIITSITIFVSGGMSVIIMANKIPIFGVIERINIGSLELWFIVFALMLFTIDIESITIKDKDKREYFN